MSKKIIRNKNCEECPKNKREDLVWRKGFEDGKEVGIKEGVERGKNEKQHKYTPAHIENDMGAIHITLYCEHCGDIKSN